MVNGGIISGRPYKSDQNIFCRRSSWIKESFHQQTFTAENTALKCLHFDSLRTGKENGHKSTRANQAWSTWILVYWLTSTVLLGLQECKGWPPINVHGVLRSARAYLISGWLIYRLLLTYVTRKAKQKMACFGQDPPKSNNPSNISTRPSPSHHEFPISSNSQILSPIKEVFCSAKKPWHSSKRSCFLLFLNIEQKDNNLVRFSKDHFLYGVHMFFCASTSLAQKIYALQ